MDDFTSDRLGDFYGQLDFQDPYALFAVGLNFEFGFCGAIDLELAKKYYSCAANKGSLPAKYRLYILLSETNQRSGNPDYLMLDLLFEIATEGYAPAMHLLAMCIWCGWGVDRNREKSIEWLNKAADQKFGPAILAQIFGIGWNGVGAESILTSNPEKMAQLRELADTRDPEAMLTIGVVLVGSADISVVKDGIGYLERAAAAGLSSAHYHLGEVYSYGGAGIVIDRKKSAFHSGMSENLQQPYARFSFPQLCENTRILVTVTHLDAQR